MGCPNKDVAQGVATLLVLLAGGVAVLADRGSASAAAEA
jgi:hypothetical protein